MKISEEFKLDQGQYNKILFKNDSRSCRVLLKDDKVGWGGRVDLVDQRKEGTIISVAPGRFYTWPDSPQCPDKSEGWASDPPSLPRFLLPFLILQMIVFKTIHSKTTRKKSCVIHILRSSLPRLQCFPASATPLHPTPPHSPSASPVTAQRLVRDWCLPQFN